MKKKTNKDLQKKLEDSMLTNLNDFMKEYGIDSINFGKTHEIKRTKGKKAKDVIKKKSIKPEIG